MDLFMKAARRKYRFNSERGTLNVEQLFDLSYTDLDKIYRELEGAKQESAGLLGRTGNTEVQNKLEIVKAVFDQKKAEADANQSRAEKAAMKDKILNALANRQAENLAQKDEDELKAMLEKL